MARTRSASAHRKILNATIELVAERGVDATSMDAIAERSGVSKATIYKHWTDKDALLLEMMAYIIGLQDRPTFDSGNIRTDMLDVLSYRPPKNAELSEKIVPHFVAYSARNRFFGEAWRKLATDRPRRELSYLIMRGIERHELDRGLNIEVALALLLGPMIYRHVFWKNEDEDVRWLAEGVVDAFWRAYGVKKAARTSRPTRVRKRTASAPATAPRGARN